MSRSLHSLRRAVFGVSCAVVFGFGVSEAVGSPQPAVARVSCPATGAPYPDSRCGLGCDGGRGYCDARGRCQCGDIP